MRNHKIRRMANEKEKKLKYSYSESGGTQMKVRGLRAGLGGCWTMIGKVDTEM
jgi:hypothetical protein